MAVSLQITTVGYYKLRSFITNCDKKLLQVKTALVFEKFKIITNHVKSYYILLQLLVLLQVTVNFVMNYGRCYKLQRYYKLR